MAENETGLIIQALTGEPLLPTIALLLVCMLWLSISIRKGGYARV